MRDTLILGDDLIVTSPGRLDRAITTAAIDGFILKPNQVGTITEAQLEAAFGQWLPVHSGACQERLSHFFTQWFDTAYPAGGGANRPMITGPGLDGPGFYSAPGACAA